MAGQLTKRERENVRAALRVLRARNGGLALLAARMGCNFASLEKLVYGVRPPGILTALRAAEMAGVPVEDVLTGRYPDRTICRHCGHPVDDVSDETEGGDVH